MWQQLREYYIFEITTQSCIIIFRLARRKAEVMPLAFQGFSTMADGKRWCKI